MMKIVRVSPQFYKDLSLFLQWFTVIFSVNTFRLTITVIFTVIFLEQFRQCMDERKVQQWYLDLYCR